MQPTLFHISDCRQNCCRVSNRGVSGFILLYIFLMYVHTNKLIYNVYNTSNKFWYNSSQRKFCRVHKGVESAMVQILYLISPFLNFYGHHNLTDNGHILKTILQHTFCNKVVTEWLLGCVIIVITRRCIK